MFYSKQLYSTKYLQQLDKKQWSQLSEAERSDIRLALSQSVVYATGLEKSKLLEIQSKLIKFSWEL